MTINTIQELQQAVFNKVLELAKAKNITLATEADFKFWPLYKAAQGTAVATSQLTPGLQTLKRIESEINVRLNWLEGKNGFQYTSDDFEPGYDTFFNNIEKDDEFFPFLESIVEKYKPLDGAEIFAPVASSSKVKVQDKDTLGDTQTKLEVVQDVLLRNLGQVKTELADKLKKTLYTREVSDLRIKLLEGNFALDHIYRHPAIEAIDILNTYCESLIKTPIKSETSSSADMLTMFTKQRHALSNLKDAMIFFGKHAYKNVAQDSFFADYIKSIDVAYAVLTKEMESIGVDEKKNAALETKVLNITNPILAKFAQLNVVFSAVAEVKAVNQVKAQGYTQMQHLLLELQTLLDSEWVARSGATPLAALCELENKLHALFTNDRDNVCEKMGMQALNIIEQGYKDVKKINGLNDRQVRDFKSEYAKKFPKTAVAQAKTTLNRRSTLSVSRPRSGTVSKSEIVRMGTLRSKISPVAAAANSAAESKEETAVGNAADQKIAENERLITEFTAAVKELEKTNERLQAMYQQEDVKPRVGEKTNEKVDYANPQLLVSLQAAISKNVDAITKYQQAIPLLADASRYTIALALHQARAEKTDTVKPQGWEQVNFQKGKIEFADKTIPAVTTQPRKTALKLIGELKDKMAIFASMNPSLEPEKLQAIENWRGAGGLEGWVKATPDHPTLKSFLNSDAVKALQVMANTKNPISANAYTEALENLQNAIQALPDMHKALVNDLFCTSKHALFRLPVRLQWQLDNLNNEDFSCSEAATELLSGLAELLVEEHRQTFQKGTLAEVEENQFSAERIEKFIVTDNLKNTIFSGYKTHVHALTKTEKTEVSVAVKEIDSVISELENLFNEYSVENSQQVETIIVFNASQSKELRAKSDMLLRTSDKASLQHSGTISTGSAVQMAYMAAQKSAEDLAKTYTDEIQELATTAQAAREAAVEIGPEFIKDAEQTTEIMSVATRGLGEIMTHLGVPLAEATQANTIAKLHKQVLGKAREADKQQKHVAIEAVTVLIKYIDNVKKTLNETIATSPKLLSEIAAKKQEINDFLEHKPLVDFLNSDTVKILHNIANGTVTMQPAEYLLLINSLKKEWQALPRSYETFITMPDYCGLTVLHAKQLPFISDTGFDVQKSANEMLVGLNKAVKAGVSVGVENSPVSKEQLDLKATTLETHRVLLQEYSSLLTQLNKNIQDFKVHNIVTQQLADKVQRISTLLQADKRASISEAQMPTEILALIVTNGVGLQTNLRAEKVIASAKIAEFLDMLALIDLCLDAYSVVYGGHADETFTAFLVKLAEAKANLTELAVKINEGRVKAEPAVWQTAVESLMNQALSLIEAFAKRVFLPSAQEVVKINQEMIQKHVALNNVITTLNTLLLSTEFRNSTTDQPLAALYRIEKELETLNADEHKEFATEISAAKNLVKEAKAALKEANGWTDAQMQRWHQQYTDPFKAVENEAQLLPQRRATFMQKTLGRMTGNNLAAMSAPAPVVKEEAPASNVKEDKKGTKATLKGLFGLGSKKDKEKAADDADMHASASSSAGKRAGLGENTFTPPSAASSSNAQGTQAFPAMPQGGLPPVPPPKEGFTPENSN